MMQEKSQKIQEISEVHWADWPVIAVFGLDGPYYVGEESEEKDETTMSDHQYFTCSQDLADRAIFVQVGTQVRGKDAMGKAVQGEIADGYWRWVVLRDENGELSPSVSVETLEFLVKDE